MKTVVVLTLIGLLGTANLINAQDAIIAKSGATITLQKVFVGNYGSKPISETEFGNVGQVRSSAGDLATASDRFSVTTDGVITDLKTGLEWVVGPDKGLNYVEAESWVKGLKIAGGGWRMPTSEELLGLRLEGDKRNGYELDPAIKDKVSPSKKIEGIGISIVIVWHSPQPNRARYVNFPFSHVLLAGRDYNGADGRVFAVRSAYKKRTG